MPDLRTKTARKRLAPRSSAYTQILAEGRALGYRRRRADKPGRWLLRTAKPQGGYSFEVLGNADDSAEADGKSVLTYAQALDVALGRNQADPTKIPVQEALNDWAKDKARSASSEKQVSDLYSAARRIGGSFPRATLKTITAREIEEWKAGDPTAAKSTVNRRLATLKAALTRAADLHGYQGSRTWLDVKKYEKAESHAPRMLILSEEDESHLIASARPDVARLLTALQMTGARYGEIRTATVGDLEGDQIALTGKTGQRVIALSPEKTEWFRILAGSRPAPSPLLTRQDGSEWPDGGQLKPVRTAVKAADLPSEVTTYTLRHGFISRALARGVPVVAVAQHCGTSAEMIEASYAKFIKSAMAGWFA